MFDAKDFEPKNPESVKPIIVGLAGLLGRLSSHNHRYLSGKNVIPGTGVFVKQSRADRNMYTLLFYTPDDIGVQCQVDMAGLLKDYTKEITSLLVGACRVIEEKRGHGETIH